VASRSQKFHGRVEGVDDPCGIAGCREPGEFRAPVTPGDFDGPGQWRYLCLDHVRAHNLSYNYFNGMSPDEIEEAQSPIAGWERTSRPFAHVGDPPPAWSDFHDPLDAIATLKLLQLGDDADRLTLRKRYSELVRRYHPDRNGGDRSHERALGAVIEAYTLLKSSRAFA
jgi:hypothetical protein